MKKIIYSLGQDIKVVEVDDDEVNIKQKFFELKDNIISIQKDPENSSPESFMLVDNVVYQISPSVGHKKITGQAAKDFKRRVRVFQ